MGNSKSHGIKKTDQTIVSNRQVIKRQCINIPRVQNVLLIWVDSNVDENNDDYKNTINHLRTVVNEINIYTDGDQGVQFIQTIEDNKVCIIISGSLGQHVVPCVHDMSQVDSIFVFCHHEKRHEVWAKDWPKIKGVFTEITSICESLKQAAQHCEHNATPMSFVASGQRVDHQDPSFMYTQILKEILLTIDFDEQHIKDYASYCREAFGKNKEELERIKQLEQHYSDKTPIWWYTCECFLYPMINRALRSMDGDIITRMGFFINDLHRQIERVHKEQYVGSSSKELFTLYRGQGLSKDDFDQLLKSKGGLMSFNSFLSTSKTRSVSLDFSRKAMSNPDLVGILFVMRVDPARSTTPFASIHEISAIKGEDEVLFAMHSVFRIHEIKPMSESNRLYEVHLSLTNENDQELRTLTDHIRKESFPDSTGWYRLALVLQGMGQLNKAEEIYGNLLGQVMADDEKAPIYHQLGVIKDLQGEYQKALTFYEKHLAISQQLLPLTHPSLASAYNNIGTAYDNMGEYSKALAWYEKALEMRKQSLPPSHPDLASSYNNIGNVYFSTGDYQKALSSYEKVLAIQKLSFPLTHPSLAVSYNNIGMVYDSMGDYPKALSSYETALVIQQQSLPPTHPHLAMSYNNIGNVHGSMGAYQRALSSHEKVLVIQQQSLPPDHPDLAAAYNNIGTVYDGLGDYSNALSWYEKALKIRQQSLPSSHPSLASSYNNIGMVYNSMDDYSKALLFHEKALAIREQSLSPTHPSLASSYNNFGMVYDRMGDYLKAFSWYDKALAIRQQSLPPTHPDLASSYSNIGMVYESIGDYPKALLSHEKALAIREKSLPSTHPDLAMSYSGIGTVHKSMNDYSKALSWYEKALAVQQQSLPCTHPDLATSYNNIGEVNENIGNYSEAYCFYEHAREIGQQSLSPSHSQLQKWRNNLQRVKTKL